MGIASQMGICPATIDSPHCFCQSNKCCFCGAYSDSSPADIVEDDGSEENTDA